MKNILALMGVLLVAGLVSAEYNVTEDLSGTLPDLGSNYLESILVAPSGLVYLGADGPMFMVYNPITNTTTDLTSSLVNIDLGDSIFVLQPIGSDIYIGSGSGKTNIYHPDTNTTEDITGVVPLTSYNNPRSAVPYSSRIYYVGWTDDEFGFYDVVTNTSTNLTPIGSSSNHIMSITLNGSGVVYYTSLGEFGVYDPITNTSYNLTTTNATASFYYYYPGVNAMYAGALSPTGLIYLAGYGGQMGVYNPTTNLTSFIDCYSFDETRNIVSLIYANSLLYYSTDSGLFGSYNPNTDECQDLTGTIPWATNGMFQIVDDGTSKIYIIGDYVANNLGAYQYGANPPTTTTTTTSTTTTSTTLQTGGGFIGYAVEQVTSGSKPLTPISTQTTQTNVGSKVSPITSTGKDNTIPFLIIILIGIAIMYNPKKR